MTTGKKISILRKNAKITQAELAKKIGVHIASIKKYEADKMKPTKEHLAKMSSVLNVRPYIISQNDYELELETVGDLYTVIFYIYHANLLVINKGINSDNINIEINPLVIKLLDLQVKKEDSFISTEQFVITINEKLKQIPTYNLFVQWVEKNEDLRSFVNSLINKDNTVAKNTINELNETIEKIELVLQQSPELLEDL